MCEVGLVTTVEWLVPEEVEGRPLERRRIRLGDDRLRGKAAGIDQERLTAAGEVMKILTRILSVVTRNHLDCLPVEPCLGP